MSGVRSFFVPKKHTLPIPALWGEKDVGPTFIYFFAKTKYPHWFVERSSFIAPRPFPLFLQNAIPFPRFAERHSFIFRPFPGSPARTRPSSAPWRRSSAKTRRAPRRWRPPWRSTPSRRRGATAGALGRPGASEWVARLQKDCPEIGFVGARVGASKMSELWELGGVQEVGRGIGSWPKNNNACPFRCRARNGCGLSLGPLESTPFGATGGPFWLCCFQKIDGFPRFTWFSHLPGPSISPKRTPMIGSCLQVVTGIGSWPKKKCNSACLPILKRKRAAIGWWVAYDSFFFHRVSSIPTGAMRRFCPSTVFDPLIRSPGGLSAGCRRPQYWSRRTLTWTSPKCLVLLTKNGSYQLPC